MFAVLFTTVTLNAQDKSYLGLHKNRFMTNIFVSGGYATGLSDMNNFLSSKSTFVGNFDDMQMLYGGFGFGINNFWNNSWSYYIGIEARRGNDLAAADNLHASMDSWNGKIGAEYFFYQNNKVTLSANLCVGVEEINFAYGQYTGEWRNYTLPVGCTFWYKNIGFNINYSPAVFRTEPNETLIDMPKMSNNSIDLTVRFAF